METRELLKLYAAGSRNFSGVSLSEPILSWADLSEITRVSICQVDKLWQSLRKSDQNWAKFL